MSERKCGTCEYHESFTGACFNGRSRNCADFTDDNDVCMVWEKRTTADEQEIQRNKKRVESTKKLASQRAEGKTCKDCAKFKRDPESKAGGWCPIPKKDKVGMPIGDKKYVFQSHLSCGYFEDKEDNS